jgi:precorrin-6A/cobalt-precorrin-6A reductase
MCWSLAGKASWSAMQDPDVLHLLILGGTAEAARLVDALHDRFGPELAVTTSLAGMTRAPRALPGSVRVGGFGGADGLADWLRAHHVGFVIDATHPFASQMSANVREACDAVSLPRLSFVRAPWTAADGDNWRNVSNLDTAAALLPDLAKRVFLSIGSARLDLFSGLRNVHLVVRMIDSPEKPLPLADYSVILARGPFDEAAERKLLCDERIEAVVSRNSGGAATVAKIKAAKALGLPVVMISPPVRETGECVESLEGALKWITKRIEEARRA